MLRVLVILMQRKVSLFSGFWIKFSVSLTLLAGGWELLGEEKCSFSCACRALICIAWLGRQNLMFVTSACVLGLEFRFPVLMCCYHILHASFWEGILFLKHSLSCMVVFCFISYPLLSLLFLTVMLWSPQHQSSRRKWWVVWGVTLTHWSVHSVLLKCICLHQK